jgi:peptidoglycan LD-endopeptidase LytH
MKKLLAPFFLIIIFISFSCNSKIKNVFRGERTPHESYQDLLDDKDLDKTPLGRQWLAASEAALQYPHTIQLPYRQHGYFHTDKPRALRIIFSLDKKGQKNFVIYADVYKQNSASASRLLSADTTQSEFSFSADEAGTYVLRLQPDMHRTGEYSLSVAIGPSISFPVAGSRARAGSFWGADRDGGKRSHEGVDIFAPKGTPAIAAADGYVTGVREGGIGGKTVWLRPEGKNYTLYYAHLDEQLVTEGQLVKKGDTVGTVGNTGNARTTPAHLHFGIYAYSGAVDPWPFINKAEKKAPAITQKKMTDYVKLVKNFKLDDGSALQANTVLVPLAVTAKGYLSETPDGKKVQVPFALVKSISPAASVTSKNNTQQDKS